MCDFGKLPPLAADEYRIDTACELISPLFADPLADRWRCSAWVVPPGAMTPVHDHLACRLVGVHRVRTTSAETSVSIHLLANDTGCVWRHTFDERTGETSPFRSGHVNAECDSE